MTGAVAADRLLVETVKQHAASAIAIDSVFGNVVILFNSIPFSLRYRHNRTYKRRSPLKEGMEAVPADRERLHCADWTENCGNY
jgi:hypothetical protein